MYPLILNIYFGNLQPTLQLQYLDYIFIQILIYLHEYTDAIPYVTNNV